MLLDMFKKVGAKDSDQCVRPLIMKYIKAKAPAIMSKIDTGDLKMENIKDKEDYEAKRKAIQDLQMDPNTAGDEKLKKEIVRRKHELEKEARLKGFKENEDVMKDKIKAWADKYDGYVGSNGDSLPEGYVQYALNSGIPTDFIETNERAKMDEKYGEEKFEEDPGAYISDHIDEMPITKACMEELHKITGSDDLEDNAELIKKYGDLGYEEDRAEVDKAFAKTMPSKVTGYYEIIDFWKEHTQMWGKKPEEVKYEIADWMVSELKPDNTPEREELTKRAWAIVDDVIKNNDEDMTFDDMIDKLSTNESGIMYRAGVKKYGKAGMKAIQSAAGKGASHQEIGKIKDKHLKDEVGETATVGATAAGNIATVANPHIANSKAKPKKQKPTDNALDNKSHGLFGQPLKRLNNSKEVTMDKDTELKENLADMASKVEQDHEVQMARAQLYKIAKYSIKMHEMLKNVSEQEGLEGWVQSKITKAADYMGAVYHNMDYEQKFEEVSESADCGCDTHETHSKCKDDCDCDPVTEGKAKNPKQQAAIAISKKEKGYKESLADKLAENLDLKKKTDQDTDESGIMYKAGVKKYGKDGMKKIQSAAGKGASAEEIGKIKDKHNKKKKESYSSLEESVGKEITEEEFEKLAEKKDACYHKVKSRYKVWPSAYASGALVQCRKKGAANWGNSKKKKK